ncbi:AAA family ATPase [Deltaproteobacteria bacterium TL4]
MLPLPGFHYNQPLFENERSLIYRGIRDSDQLPVIIKTINTEYPSPEQTGQLRREYDLLKDLDCPGIVKVLGFEMSRMVPFLIMEDIQGKSLAEEILRKKPDLETRIHLSIQIAEVVEQVHHQNIIHKDINPFNIIWNSEENLLKITDFGISTKLTQENPEVINLKEIEGTLAYMSPEQTGRMNRNLDWRTDLYSLGVLFYEMFTGTLPFHSKTPMEMVHCHMAHIPLAPDEIRTELPAVISEIIMKLLEKSADERYQSAYGVKADLKVCLEQWKTHQDIKPFPLATHDLFSHFQVVQKLFGRESELQILKDTFKRVSLGTKEMLLLSGQPGIGKSALIHELHKAIVDKKSFFVSGKFEQLQHNIPYAPLLSAFQMLIRHILIESDASIENWKKRLTAALGKNGKVISEVIPEIEMIIGEQPPVPTLAIQESQNRFNFVFQEFIKVFAAPQHPLVLIIDDLQ